MIVLTGQTAGRSLVRGRSTRNRIRWRFTVRMLRSHKTTSLYVAIRQTEKSRMRNADHSDTEPLHIAA